MSFDPQFALSIVPPVLRALGTTFLVTFGSSLLASILGLALELLRRESRIGRMCLRIVIDFIRSTPVLVQLYFFYFVLPSIGVRLPAIVVGIWAIGLYYSGYLAEVFKAGIDAVPAGQWEGANALGFSRLQTVVLVIAPQMLSKVAGPVCGYFISIFKTTPYLAVITVPDAFGAALDIATESFRYTEPMVVAGCVFLLVALCMVHLTRRLELRLGVAQAH